MANEYQEYQCTPDAGCTYTYPSVGDDLAALGRSVDFAEVEMRWRWRWRVGIYLDLHAHMIRVTLVCSMIP
jgi:hypothetical protein